MSTVLEKSFAEVWERTVQPTQTSLPPDAARYFLQLRFADPDRARMNELGGKVQAGSLTPAEEVELSHYLQLGWFLDLMHSKARRALGQPPAEA